MCVREFLCSYCYPTPDTLHRCDLRGLGCRSTGSPTSKSHWYVANCSVEPETLCLGKKVFREGSISFLSVSTTPIGFYWLLISLMDSLDQYHLMD